MSKCTRISTRLMNGWWTSTDLDSLGFGVDICTKRIALIEDASLGVNGYLFLLILLRSFSNFLQIIKVADSYQNVPVGVSRVSIFGYRWTLQSVQEREVQQETRTFTGT